MQAVSHTMNMAIKRWTLRTSVAFQDQQKKQKWSWRGTILSSHFQCILFYFFTLANSAMIDEMFSVICHIYLVNVHQEVYILSQLSVFPIFVFF